MKICIVGNGHLATVIASCLAIKNFDVFFYSEDKNFIKNFKLLKFKIAEPGLEHTFKKHLGKNFQFLNNLNDFKKFNFIWFCYDTPLKKDNTPIESPIKKSILKISKFINKNCSIVISSQVKAGFTNKLKEIFIRKKKKNKFYYIPENLVLGKAQELFLNTDRFIVGLDGKKLEKNLKQILLKFTKNIYTMSIISAELSKHCINSFLAMSVVFINEIYQLSEKIGASPKEIEIALKSEARIGPHAYLKPGNAFSGGTLARDLKYLKTLSKENNNKMTVINSIYKSNELHKQFIKQKIIKFIGNKKEAILLGLSYKKETNSMLNSFYLDLCKFLIYKGIKIKIFEPNLKKLPNQLFKASLLSKKDLTNNSDIILVNNSNYLSFVKGEKIMFYLN